jgi:2'-5' RNA ligase
VTQTIDRKLITADGSPDYSGGVMVALVPAEPEKFAVENGLDPNELHMTLSYHGDVSDGELPENGSQMIQAAASLLGRYLPMVGTVAGIGQLGPEGANVLFINVPEMDHMRSELTRQLNATGVPPKGRGANSFIPHMTLTYNQSLEGSLDLLDQPIVFDKIIVEYGPETYLVAHQPYIPEEQESPEEEAQETPEEEQAEQKQGTESPLAAAAEVPPGEITDKVSKEQSNYRTPDPESEQLCGNCANFEMPDQCVLVIGPIDSKDVCDLWEPVAPPAPTRMSEGEQVVMPMPVQSSAEMLDSVVVKNECGPIRLKISADQPRLESAKMTDTERQVEISSEVFDLFESIRGLDQEIIDKIKGLTAGASVTDIAEKRTGIMAASFPVKMKREWFDNPNLKAPTPLTVTDDGRVYGHIAQWGTCHIGMEGCTLPPKSSSGYGYFKTGIVKVGNEEIPVGHITMDTGHAPVDEGLVPAAAHYDNTGAVVADVTAGEDEFGIWVSGAIRPGTSIEKVYSLRASAPSGDWRAINNSHELVAILAVNVPGFPIPRTLAASAYGFDVDGKLITIIASGKQGTDPAIMDRINQLEQRIESQATILDYVKPMVASAMKQKMQQINKEDVD